MAAVATDALATVAEAIATFDGASPEESAVRVREALGAVMGRCLEDASAAEALLECVVQSLVTTGEHGKALLDDMVLELLPTLASLAPQSGACCKQLSALAELAAAACSPRDTITAFLEVMSTLLAESDGPAAIQFLCGLMALLPGLLCSLSRRRAAFATECCQAVASLSKVHGDVLAAWALAPLSVAAQQQGEAATALARLDTFLAANWQAYSDFVQQCLHKVLAQEADAAAQASARDALAVLILQLLQRLTLTWPPAALQPLAVQLLARPAAQQHLPSASSVAPPPAVAGVVDCTKSARLAAGIPHTRTDAQAMAAAAAAAARQARTEAAAGQQQQQQQQQQLAEGEAERVVLQLLRLLTECGCADWQQAAAIQGAAGAGAGLAALYSCCIPLPKGAAALGAILAPPDSPGGTIQLACAWCCAMAEASDGNVLAVGKALVLLQLAAAHAQQLQRPPSASACLPDTAADNGSPSPQPALPQALLRALHAAVVLLAGVASHAPLQLLRSQASLALQQVLTGLPPRVAHACLQQLLSSSGGGGSGDGCGGGSSSAGQQQQPDALHPEVAALLMQEVRLQLANGRAVQAGAHWFGPASCIDLVLPWLRQRGAVGWRDSDTLPDRANAVCAALAVVRLALLQAQHQPAGGGRAAAATAAAATPPQQQQLASALVPLRAAVKAALQQLQAEGQAGEAAAPGGGSSGGDGRQRVPGQASGSGDAVDAWLAVSRVQDVLERVLELLQ